MRKLYFLGTFQKLLENFGNLKILLELKNFIRNVLELSENYPKLSEIIRKSSEQTFQNFFLKNRNF